MVKVTTDRLEFTNPIVKYIKQDIRNLSILYNKKNGLIIMHDYLNKEVKVIVDRPLASKHPEHEIYYPINYGYIPNTISGDGEEIDAYIIGEFQPLKDFNGIVIAIIHRENDVEDKLVVSKYSHKYSKEQIQALVEFQERFFQSEIIMS